MRRPRLRKGDGPARPRVRRRRLRAAMRSVAARVRRARARLAPRSSRAWDTLATLVTLVLFAITWPTTFMTHEVAASLAPLVAAAGVAPLLLARARPFAGWTISAAVAALVGLWLPPLPAYAFPWPVPHFLVLLGLLFTVALRASTREVAIAWGATSAIFLLVLPADLRAGWVFGGTMLTVVALLLRWLVLSRRELARQEQVSEMERARRAVLEERSRIARDLHDVVAHSMSMVVVQAQSAPHRLGGVSPEVKREFDSIGEAARQALNEVRGMLGVLRSDGQLAEDLPQPELTQVETLLCDTKAAGVDLDWRITGDPEGCSAATAMVLVRVLQESLANASRHAPGGRVQVEVGYRAPVIRVRVANTAGDGTMPAPTGRHSGKGVAGMVSRVQALGGTLTAEPTADGGFEVCAEVPMAATGASPAAAVPGRS